MIRLLATIDWRLWFLELSGWPAFLASVVAAILFALGLSVLMPMVSHRSVLQNAILAVIVVALAGLGLVGTFVLASRFAFDGQ